MADQINIIVAHSKNFVIGKGGSIPWCNSKEMAHFKKMTMGHTVIMGRKTWESLAGPLSGRKNIVVTSSAIEGVTTTKSLEEALAITQD
jgi:dihydrofolate reductase